MRKDEGEGIDLLQLHLVGGRLHPEKSYAHERRLYQDPARVVKFQGGKCTNCQHERMINTGEWMVGVCAKRNQDGSPRLYGTRCIEFKGKGI